jgi:hypothetical protein
MWWTYDYTLHLILSVFFKDQVKFDNSFLLHVILFHIYAETCLVQLLSSIWYVIIMSWMYKLNICWFILMYRNLQINCTKIILLHKED